MDRDQIRIFEDIIKIIAESDNPENTLEHIVQVVADRFKTEVCSVYVYNPAKDQLVLKATVGLSKESIGSIIIDTKEGLTGLVIESMKPVFVVHPSDHPRFKYYEGSGEEIFQTFLGLPLIYHQMIYGVLVIQTIAIDSITQKDISIFENISGLISAIVAYTGIWNHIKPRTDSLKDLKQIPSIEKNNHKILKRQYLRGVPVSEHVSEGYAYYLPDNIDFDQVHFVRIDDVESELIRLDTAFIQAEKQVKDLAKRTTSLDGENLAIIDAYLMQLSDKSLRYKIIEHIKQGNSAEFALKTVIMSYMKIFNSMKDLYSRERGNDIMDIGRQVLGNLLDLKRTSHHIFEKETIVVASDISPVDLLAIQHPNLKGIVLAKGGRTSHTVIIANSLEIPIIIGVEGLLDIVKQEDYLIVDGNSGFVFSNPPAEILNEYTRQREEKEKYYQNLKLFKDMPAITKDAFEVKIGANIGLLSDTDLVKKYGADHIGLYRTEFPFMLRKAFPTEEEQTLLYKKVISKSDGKTVTIRTFDVGGDKFLPYMDYPKEENPFLGWRSIRICLEIEDVFRTQIRSILKSSALGKVNILFPMITCVEEIKKVIEIVNEEKKFLLNKEVPIDQDIKLGIMVEVPSAVFILDHLLRYVDFVSIGTNDLIQYLLAVDRNNKKISSLYTPFHPSALYIVHKIIKICKKHNKMVSICGEAASNQLCLLLYIGMGIDSISINPSSIPKIKDFIRHIKQIEARKILDRVFEMETADEIERFVTEKK